MAETKAPSTINGDTINGVSAVPSDSAGGRSSKKPVARSAIRFRAYDVGTRGPNDKAGQTFDTPTLIEIWRTGPYLHDGSAATIRELLTTRNGNDMHGKTSDLNPEEIDALREYVLSL